MKLIVAILTLSFIPLMMHAQSKDLDKANDFFNEFNYAKAIKKYKGALNDGKHVEFATLQIAKAYSKLGNSHEAIKWYKKAINYSGVDATTYFFLSGELHKIKEYEEAQVYLEKFYSKYNANEHHLFTNLKGYIEYLKADSSTYTINHPAFNSQYDEFAPVFYKDEIVFSSNRPLSSITRNKDILTGKSFYKLYKIKETNLEIRKEIKPFCTNINSKYNDGPVCFEDDFNIMYLTRNTEGSRGNTNVLNLFIGIKNGKNWLKKLQPLNLFSGPYNMAHAFLDSKNRLLYFSSDIPGGYGGMDIYVSRIKDGFLSKPKNLGPAINTIGNEIFPFISSENKLYFTSDGHPGMGGYDLFFSKLKNDVFSKAFNMGYPINTSFDDFSLILDNTNKYGYFTSNRPGGNGGDDIYSVAIKKPTDYCLIKGTLVNSDNNTPIKEISIDIENNNDNFKITLTTDEDGRFSYYLKKEKRYTLSTNKRPFQNNIKIITPDMIRQSDELEIRIKLKKQ